MEGVRSGCKAIEHWRACAYAVLVDVVLLNAAVFVVVAIRLEQ